MGAAVNVSPMMAANNPTFTNMMNEFNKNTQTLMIVSKDDLENVVQNAVNRLLEKRENKPEVYLSAEETARPFYSLALEQGWISDHYKSRQ